MKQMTPCYGCVVVLVLVFILPVSAASIPQADFVSNVTSGTGPLSVLFIDSSTNTPTAWLWSFGDGSTSSDRNPAHTYTTAGTYSVTLTATNAAGSSTVTYSGYITVSTTGAGPVASFVANVTSGKIPLSVLFVDGSTNSPASWSWSFGDGSTSAAQNPSHTYTSAGTYTVTLTATNADGSNTLSRSGYISVTKEAAVPVASFAATSTEGTVPLTIQFVDASTNAPASWIWSFGDGESSAEQNPSHTYTTAGTYTITLTATNAAGSDTITRSDYITADISAPVTSFTADVLSGPAPLTVNFTDTSTNSPTDWYWYLGDESTSSDQNVTHTYTVTGTYSVQLTAYNDEGSDTLTRSGYITVTDAVTSPTAAFIADYTEGTAPLSVQFTDTSDNSPTAWVWTFGDGESSTLPNPAHTYTAEGTYTVSLTASNTGGTDTLTKSGYITISPAGTVSGTPQVTTETTVAEVTPAETGTTVTPDTTVSDSGGSFGILPFAIAAVLVVIGVAFVTFQKRPPRGPRYAGKREL